MSGQLFISLLSPSIGILFAAAFFLLWRNQRNLNYSLSAAVGFLSTSVGFVIQDILPAWPFDLQRMSSNLCFLLGMCALTIAPLQRRHIQPPARTLAAVVALSMFGLFWYLIIDLNLAARIAIASVGLAIPVLLSVVRLSRASNRRFSDRLILSVLWFTLLLSIMRPAVAFLMPESFGNYTALEQSTYWGLVHFTFVLMAVTMAIALLVAIALDLMDALHHQATTDPLSGLLNRRGFEEAANAALAGRHLTNQSAALMIADLDHFKRINDSHGHAMGDAVIQALGRHIRTVAGDAAVCGRIGGEEFAILLPGHDRTAAAKIAETIRSFDVGFAEITPPPTASIGLVVSGHTTTLSALLKIADKALYEAKHRGRNQVCVLAHEGPDQDSAGG